VPFGWSEGDAPPGGAPFTYRKGVDAGVDVIDLAAMRAQLEADRDRRPT
jgi:hypothetical protein